MKTKHTPELDHPDKGIGPKVDSRIRREQIWASVRAAITKAEGEVK